MMPLKVQASQDIPNVVEDLLARLNRVATTVEKEAQSVFDSAKAEWPVKTGRSRDELTLKAAIVNSAPVVSIESPTEYTRFIKAKKLKGKQPFRELVAKPSRKAAKRLARDLLNDLIGD